LLFLFPAKKYRSEESNFQKWANILFLMLD